MPFYHQKLVKTSPVKLPLTLAYHLEGIQVDYAVIISIFETNQLGDVEVGFDTVQLRVYGQVELYRFYFGIFEVEESDVVAVKKLDNVLIADHLIYTSSQLSLPDAGKYPLHFELLVYAVVFEQIHLVVIGIATYTKRY